MRFFTLLGILATLGLMTGCATTHEHASHGHRGYHGYHSEPGHHARHNGHPDRAAAHRWRRKHPYRHHPRAEAYRHSQRDVRSWYRGCKCECRADVKRKHPGKHHPRWNDRKHRGKRHHDKPYRGQKHHDWPHRGKKHKDHHGHGHDH
ncbi:MAG: hypothetical protein R3336_01170 [Phycisphaeraceae bacterium]|nr:hypothetical protein [Phycisphaeraceae bacterium]